MFLLYLIFFNYSGMSNSRMTLLVISILVCLLAQTTCNVQYRKIYLDDRFHSDCYLFLFSLANIDEDTGCPLNVDHVCATCAEDQNRLGCYCELASGDPIVTASVFTPCPAGKNTNRIKKILVQTHVFLK